jgi:vancomycin resistance protein YoaR
MFLKKMFLIIPLVVMSFLPISVVQAIPERGDMLSNISFQLDDSDNTQNARLAAKFINGTIVQPNKEFSFNNTTGRRTSDKGFIAGHFPVWEKGKVVDYYVTGSGVCRTSTGVHLAALRAGLKITERWPHDVPVGYVKYGEDAAVNWGDADMRFVNNQVFPVRIVIIVNNENILRAQIIRAY